MSVGDIMSSMEVFSTLGFPYKFNCFPNDLPPHLSRYPPGVLVISPSVLYSSQCTHDIPHFTHDVQCTEHPLLYCTFPGVLHRHYAG